MQLERSLDRGGEVACAVHAMHALIPSTLLYVPRAHGAQKPDEFAPICAEYDPRSQERQGPDPARSLKVPAKHGSQAPPSGPANPGLHLQSDAASLPGTEYALAGHAVLVVPASQKLPAGHRLQEEPPSSSA